MTGRWPLALAAVLCALFFGAVVGHGSPLFAHAITQKALTVVASASKLAALGAGAFFASRSARSFDDGSAIRAAWRLMTGWFVCFFAGQTVLTAYELARGAPPVPSVGDAFFAVGYVVVIAASVQFVAAYRSSGFPVGELKGHLLMALGAAIVFAFVGVTILTPVATSDTPALARVVNVGYPVLDFILLVPTLVLLRMTFAFRGGRVWTIWGTLLAGIVLFTAADIMFAIPGAEATVLAPLSDLCFLLGYGCACRGVALQRELLG